MEEIEVTRRALFVRRYPAAYVWKSAGSVEVDEDARELEEGEVRKIATSLTTRPTCNTICPSLSPKP